MSKSPLEQTDPFFQNFFADIPPELGHGFSDEQLNAVKQAFGARSWGSHPVDIRMSSPIPLLRFYLVLLAGRERRSRERLRSQKNMYPLWTPANIIAIAIFGAMVATSAIALFSLLFSTLSPVTNTTHPALIPWLDTPESCEQTGRIWQDNQCWDRKHNPTF
jgi:hypothetical protein